MGWNVDKICLYPYGGMTRFSEDINRKISEELLILISGPLVQSIYFFIGNELFKSASFNYYNIAILSFNLLPIYPLDGGRILNLLFNYFWSFRTSYHLSMIISFGVAFLLLWISLVNGYTLNIILMFLIVISKLVKEFKKRRYYFNKFILERYMNNYNFSKLKIISSIKKMMRDYRHIIKNNDTYYTEKEYLNKLYRSK